MAKTKVNTAVPDASQTKQLSSAESMSFVLAERDLQLAQAAEKQASILLRAQELEAHVALTATRQQVEKAKADVTQAQAQHRRLSDHLAASYHFDWKTSGFDPVTGTIEPLPTDEDQKI